MWWILLIPVVLLTVAFVLFRPVPLVLKRHRAIKAPRDEIFAKVRDFRSWPEWSPWLLAEPDAQVTYTKNTTNVGGKYSWNGDIVGAGEMEHIEIREPYRLDMALRFTKPYKSTAKVTMELRDVNHGTDVAWSMDSKMPAVMIPMFRTMIGMDYDRGLRMLGELMETGTILSRLEVHGTVDRPAIYWIGIESSCSMDNIGPAMTKSFEELKERIEAAGITPTLCLSIYTKWDFKTTTCNYTAAFGVESGLGRRRAVGVGDRLDHGLRQTRLHLPAGPRADARERHDDEGADDEEGDGIGQHVADALDQIEQPAGTHAGVGAGRRCGVHATLSF